ncbi:hypothetical protein LTDYDHKI_CDS0032 [Exiguobacterium phage phiExGM16]|uniref:hypothetical protein n=1 Tax=Bacillati TaxID=1783272 RepID=UPI003246BE19
MSAPTRAKTLSEAIADMNAACAQIRAAFATLADELARVVERVADLLETALPPRADVDAEIRAAIARHPAGSRVLDMSGDMSPPFPVSRIYSPEPAALSWITDDDAARLQQRARAAHAGPFHELLADPKPAGASAPRPLLQSRGYAPKPAARHAAGGRR